MSLLLVVLLVLILLGGGGWGYGRYSGAAWGDPLGFVVLVLLLVLLVAILRPW